MNSKDTKFFYGWAKKTAMREFLLEYLKLLARIIAGAMAMSNFITNKQYKLKFILLEV